MLCILHCSPVLTSNAMQLASIPFSPVLHVLYVLHCSPVLISNAMQLASIPCSPVLHVLMFSSTISNATQLARLSIQCSPVLYVLPLFFMSPILYVFYVLHCFLAKILWLCIIICYHENNNKECNLIQKSRRFRRRTVTE